jgi:hypothetical protein
MKSFIRLLCLHLAAVVLVFAQRGPTETAEQIHVRGFSYERPLPELHVVQGREAVPFALQPYEPGAETRVPPTGEALVFIRPPEKFTLPDGSAGDPRAAPLAQWTRVASTTLPAGSRRVMLAFVPQPPASQPVAGGASPDPFRVIVIDDDPKAFPVGSLRLINFSPHELAFELGGVQGTLAPGAQKVEAPKLDQKHRTYLRLATQQGGQWQLFHQGVASVLPHRRSTYLVVFSVSRQIAEGMDLVRGRDGRPVPIMIAIPWADEPEALTAGGATGGQPRG